MLRCGLLGERLSHSWSPQIHSMLGDYSYELFERSPDVVEDFIRNGSWDGLNVTIPYKKTAAALCDELSETAKELMSVNTLVRRPDGSLFGDNTDYCGFERMVRKSGVSVSDKKALVLGSGGASVTVCAVLKKLGAGEIVVISRSGENNYNNISKHNDAGIIVNSTPVGMYPDNGSSPVDLSMFPKCGGVFDIIYNPSRTALILQAEKLGIPNKSGLCMLVSQAAVSSGIFTGVPIEGQVVDAVEKKILSKLQNLILTGMPGSGKSTVAAVLAERLSAPLYETDEMIVRRAGMTIPEIFQKYGEEHFRKLETEIISEAGKLSGAVISTGGGCVTREENYPLLHQNGVIVWIRRDINSLDKSGRPLSQAIPPEKLYEQRKAAYARFADHIADNDGTPEEAADRIMELIK